jgi:hypothetical protein
VGLRCSGNAHNTCRKPRVRSETHTSIATCGPRSASAGCRSSASTPPPALSRHYAQRDPGGCHSAAPRNAPARRVPRKTPASIRDIPLAPQLAALLLRHRLASRVSGEHVFASSVGTPLGHRTPSSAASPMPRNAHASLGPTSRATLDGGMLQRGWLLGVATPPGRGQDCAMPGDDSRSMAESRLTFLWSDAVAEEAAAVFAAHALRIHKARRADLEPARTTARPLARGDRHHQTSAARAPMSRRGVGSQRTVDARVGRVQSVMRRHGRKSDDEVRQRTEAGASRGRCSVDPVVQCCAGRAAREPDRPRHRQREPCIARPERV